MTRRTCSGVEETQIKKVLKGAQKKHTVEGITSMLRSLRSTLASFPSKTCKMGCPVLEIAKDLCTAPMLINSTKYVMSYDVTASARSVRKIERNCPLTKAPRILATSPKCEQRQFEGLPVVVKKFRFRKCCKAPKKSHCRGYHFDETCWVFKFPIVGNSNFKLWVRRFPSTHPGLKFRFQLFSPPLPLFFGLYFEV